MLSLERLLRKSGLLLIATALLLGVTTARVAADPIIHTVESGDTLYSLAQRYGTSVADIMQANGLRDSSVVYRGQQLIIPADGGDPEMFQPAPAVGSHGTYTVRPGDTLIGIALRFGTTVRELTQLNNIAHSGLIYAGQRLQLPTVSRSVDGSVIPPGLKRIEVSVAEQRMWVYEGDRLIWDWPISTGLPGYPTRYGRFQIISKIPMAYSRPWQLWMPHWLGIYWAGGTENGIHSLPIKNGQKLWEGHLGTRISYGCVVVGTVEGEKLFNWADVGTTVIIRE